jgi:hypothetical protein
VFLNPCESEFQVEVDQRRSLTINLLRRKTRNPVSAVCRSRVCDQDANIPRLGIGGSDRQFMRAPRPPPLWSVALHLLHYREVPAWKVPVDDESADVISQDLCSGPSPRAPAGYWCNGLSLVSADLDARAVHSLATNDTHTRRALEAGGCCCEVCQAECLSSYVYNCTACTGAVTPACAACYLSAQNHYNLTGACWDPPPSLPTIPLGPTYLPAPSSPERVPFTPGIDVMGMILLCDVM